MYDYYLGGSHNFEVDREAARKAMAVFPGLPKVMQANRAFMRRAVRYLISQGITQFLDIGSGIPTFGNVHEIAQEASDQARVVYVDNDPVAVAHSKSVLGDDPRTGVVAGDFLEPRSILDSEPVSRLLGLDRPVALLLVALLHFMRDEDRPYEVLAEYRQALAPGSYLVITHAAASDPGTRKRGAAVTDVYRRGGSTLELRSRDDIARFFEGFTLVEPGLVTPPEWRPESPLEDEDPVVFNGLAGVGRKA